MFLMLLNLLNSIGKEIKGKKGTKLHLELNLTQEFQYSHIIQFPHLSLSKKLKCLHKNNLFSFERELFFH